MKVKTEKVMENEEIEKYIVKKNEKTKTDIGKIK